MSPSSLASEDFIFRDIFRMKRIPGFPSLSPEIKSRLVFHFPLEPVVKGECDKISQDLYHILQKFLSVKEAAQKSTQDVVSEWLSSLKLKFTLGFER